MNKQLSSNNTKLDKFLTEEQFDQVVEAILIGKYSWACVLILRFAGYNPLHYIPYRTYNRILKQSYQNQQNTPDISDKKNRIDSESFNNDFPKNERNCLSAIADLDYLEIAGDLQSEIKGGYRELPLDFSHWFYLSE